MINKIDNIVIVGGGSAGWMTATTMVSVFPEKKITVIESPTTPTVGVGESTLAFLNDWLFLVGIKKEDFMAECDASYKLSIKFTDFLRHDSGSFHYPFGRPAFDLDLGPNGSQMWYIKKMMYEDVPVSDYADSYYPVMSLVNSNKFAEKIGDESCSFDAKQDAAVHFDASLFGMWLKNKKCIPAGVGLKNNDIVSFSENESGIEYLILDNGEKVYADLFIDCTGFKSLLLGNYLKEEFIDYTELLPNNRAWATRIPYSDKEKELEPFTSCTAIQNGWVWNIPSWNRIGTGYVYSDKYISPEEALKQFKDYLRSDRMTVQDKNRDVDSFEYKDIKMRVGIHKRTWVKNVLAIGLSAGFIEPLESSGLFTVHQFLMLFAQIMDREKITQWDRDSYNMIAFQQFNTFADFVALHYALSQRDDTKYWKDITNKTFYPEIINENFTNNRTPVDLIVRKIYSNSWSERDSYSGSSSGLNCIATGMNYNILTPVGVFLTYTKNNVDVKSFLDRNIEVWESNTNKWKKQAENADSLFDYLSKNIYGDNNEK